MEMSLIGKVIATCSMRACGLWTKYDVLPLGEHILIS